MHELYVKLLVTYVIICELFFTLCRQPSAFNLQLSGQLLNEKQIMEIKKAFRTLFFCVRNLVLVSYGSISTQSNQSSIPTLHKYTLKTDQISPSSFHHSSINILGQVIS